MYEENTTHRPEPEFEPRVKGLGLVGGDRDVSPAPLQQAFSRNESIISELEMAIESLESKTSPVRMDAPRPEREVTAPNKPHGNSPVTRAMEDLSDRLHRSVIRVRRLTEELEI